MDTTTAQELRRPASLGASEEHVLDRDADNLTGKPERDAAPAVDRKDEKLPRGLRIALAIALGVLSWALIFAVARWVVL
ncbi:hypothetical protein [Hyphococcus sp.]|uniref:hypothetical protein n=1 Tax=Hyphococcus sp. TaxID=2038636 RepID=UPI0035C77488